MQSIDLTEQLKSGDMTTQILFDPKVSSKLELAMGDFKGMFARWFEDDFALMPEIDIQDQTLKDDPRGPKQARKRSETQVNYNTSQGSHMRTGEWQIVDEYLRDAGRLKEFLDLKRQLRATGYDKEYWSILAVAKMRGSEEQQYTIVTDDDALISLCKGNGIDFVSTKALERSMRESGRLNQSGFDLILQSKVTLTDRDYRALSDESLDTYFADKIRSLPEGQRIPYAQNVLMSLIGAKAGQLTNADVNALAQHILTSTESADNVGLGLGGYEQKSIEDKAKAWNKTSDDNATDEGEATENASKARNLKTTRVQAAKETIEIDGMEHDIDIEDYEMDFGGGDFS